VARSGVINFGYLEPRSLPIVLTGTAGTIIRSKVTE
jgi:hypothetical protein